MKWYFPWGKGEYIYWVIALIEVGLQTSIDVTVVIQLHFTLWSTSENKYT